MIASEMGRGLTLLNPLVCLYHSRILFSVDFLVRSNMKRMATASLDTSGSIETNSRCPAGSVSSGMECCCWSYLRDPRSASKSERMIMKEWQRTYAECYIRAPYADRLFHKVNAECLYVILATKRDQTSLG